MLERFKEVFAGLSKAYGETIKTNNVREDGKKETKNFIRRLPVTHDHWKNHLEGTGNILGIIPIRDNNSCKWGCIDIDDYSLDHKQFIKKVRDLKLPLIVCRSKSGGAHVFIFIDDFVEAAIVRDKLKQMAAILGYAKTEIYPKQDNVIAERGDIGSYLNIPYFNYKDPIQYALSDEGEKLSLEEFFKMHDQYVLTPDQLYSFKTKQDKKINDKFKGMPPCLVSLLKEKLGEGKRNDFFYNLSVYLKKRHGDDWKDHMMDYNTEEFMETKLKLDEINNIIKSVEKKDYKYACPREPLASYCQPKICAKREFGIGDDIPMPEITQIRKFDSDPPMYFVSLDGQTIRVDAETLHDPDKFSKASMVQANEPLLPIPKTVWRMKIRSKMKEDPDSFVIPAPDELKNEFVITELLKDYVSKDAKDMTDVLRGRPFTDDAGATHFTLKGFKKFVDRVGDQDRKFKQSEIVGYFKDLFNGENSVKTIKNESCRIWSFKKLSFKKIDTRKNEKKEDPFV